MKTAAVIAEYNPFHKGHEYQLQKTRELGATHVIVIMSGSFTQRGECACLSKFARAKMALLCGADLVLELPLPWAVAPAGRFAAGAMEIIDALRCVDFVAFGSECGDMDALYATSRAVLTVESSLFDLAREGRSLASSRWELVNDAFGEDIAAPLTNPNDTLGVEYILASERLENPIPCRAIKRIGSAHDAPAPEEGFASASYIRSVLADGGWKEYIPEKCIETVTAELEKGRGFASMDNLERAMLAKLRRMDTNEISKLYEASEGLENRVFDKLRLASSLDELYSLIKTKRYAHSRIRRLLLSAFLGIPADLTASLPPYIRILGMNGTGREILAGALPRLPMVTRYSDIKKLDDEAQQTFALECASGDLWALATPKVQPCGIDLTGKFINLG